MEKQVNSNEKFNKTSVFLTKFIFRENFDSLKKAGFVNSFVSDPNVQPMLAPTPTTRFLYLLFKNDKINMDGIRKIVETLVQVKSEIVFSYELVNDYLMVVLKWPQEYVKDFDLVTTGSYSKLSPNFKDGFPITKDVVNDKKKYIGKEYSIYHHIFNKTDWLKNFWKNKLGLVELAPDLELWDKPEEKDLFFNINTLF